MRFLFFIVLVGFLSACSTLSTSKLPSSFTTENIMKVHQGMSSDEILKMFGTPKNVSEAFCGADDSHSWTCTTWEYGEFPYDRASFTFSGETAVKVLSNFKVDRK